MPFSPEHIRSDFPALHQEVNGKPLCYLDNGATTHKPQAVIDTLKHYYEFDNSNVHRGVHTLAARADRAYEDARHTVQTFLGAEHVEEIVFTKGTTEGVNLVAQSFLRPKLQPGDEILITEMEHHANIVPWQILAEQTGAKVVATPIDDSGVLDMNAFRDLINDRTKMIGVSWISNVLGTINPVEELVAIAKDAGVPILLDAAQAVAHTKINVAQLGCDFLAFSSHKLYAPTGTGALYVNKKHYASMQPYQGGGDMIARVSFEGTTFAEPPLRFEAGTPNIAGVIGMAAGIDYLSKLDIEAIAVHEDKLVIQAHALLEEIDGLRIIGTAPNKSCAVSFVVDDVHPHDMATILDHYGVAVRAGHHCAEPLMRRFNVPATTRASFAMYNQEHEVQQLVNAVKAAVEIFT